MRSRFDDQLELLNRELTHMGALCENAIASAAKALFEGKDGQALALKAIETDSRIDQKEREIESLCLKLLLHQQPVAKDLRQISSALKMITDMERIGDQASDIAEIVRTGGVSAVAEDDKLPVAKMARAAIEMVTDSIEAFVQMDIALAESVITADDVVDDYFVQIKKALITLISEQYAQGEWALDLLMIVKYLERIGDHATNIAEWVVFSITGEHPKDKEEANDLLR
ncbi:phosphate signaling complex protein PhoU [Oscillospiraceae bacterium LTW-04]|nr:phosphate signaling complex protein PhoU [Oscillospiraceae bacterium MB24-C1]